MVDPLNPVMELEVTPTLDTVMYRRHTGTLVTTFHCPFSVVLLSTHTYHRPFFHFENQRGSHMAERVSWEGKVAHSCKICSSLRSLGSHEISNRHFHPKKKTSHCDNAVTVCGSVSMLCLRSSMMLPVSVRCPGLGSPRHLGPRPTHFGRTSASARSCCR